MRQAYETSLPSPDWDAVADLLGRCDTSPSGVAAYALGPADTLVAAASWAAPADVMQVAPDAGGMPQAAIAFYSELINGASHRRMAPSSYPVGGEHRSRLLEGDLQLIRLADLGGLSAEFDHDGVAVAMVPEPRAGRLELRVDVDGVEYTRFTDQLAEFCLWMPVPVAALRQALLEYTRVLLNERASGVDLADSVGLATGDNFAYETVYRSG